MIRTSMIEGTLTSVNILPVIRHVVQFLCNRLTANEDGALRQDKDKDG